MRKIKKTICKECFGNNECEELSIGVLKGFCVLCGNDVSGNNAITLSSDTFDKLYEQGLLNNKLPTNLSQCFDELDRMLSDNEKEDIKNIPNICLLHHGFGTYLRNKWGLWTGSVLSKQFKDHGVTHPDSMSAIILRLYNKKLNNKPLNDEYISTYPNVAKLLKKE